MKSTLIAAGLLLLGSVWAGPESADSIVARADAVRNPQGSFKNTIVVQEYERGVKGDVMVVSVLVSPEKDSGQYRSLVEIREPVRDAGKRFLKNGRDLWFYDPASKASVRISPQQRLLGQVSNGDLMSSNFARDYHAELLGTETIRNADREELECHHLKLTARQAAEVTYPVIELWVSTENDYPIKGKFFAASGRLLKTAFYRDFRQMLGGVRPGEVVILDGVDASAATRMRFDEQQAMDIPDGWFQRSALPNLGGL